MPVLTPAIARAVRDRIPASTFFDQFDRLSCAAPEGSEGLLDSFDRRLLAYLLRFRSGDRPVSRANAASALGATDRKVSRAIRRLDQHGLLPNRAALTYRAGRRARP